MINETFTLNAIPENIGQRLDIILSEEIENSSRSSIQKMIESQSILVNGKSVAKNYKIRKDDVIVVTFEAPKELEILPVEMAIDIVYEDNDVLVVNKPKGMVVHPALGHYDDTLVNGLMYHCKDSLSGINGVVRPGIVHRIDKNTSGLLIVAKNDLAHQGLATQIKEHSFLREYEAVVYGNFKQDTRTLDLPIGRNKVDRKKMGVTYENSRDAITHVEVLTRYEGYTHVKCKLETGRTHQIRVHLSHVGHPVAGDDVYGYKKVIKGLGGQCLHAKTIGFIHPITKEEMYFTSDLPEYFTKFVSGLKKF